MIIMIIIVMTSSAPVRAVERYVAREDGAAQMCVGRKLRNLII